MKRMLEGRDGKSKSQARKQRDSQILVKEAITPTRSNNHSRGASHVNQHYTTNEPAEESTRQRFSTPRHGSHSPISKLSTLSKEKSLS